jgi:hypothetical protein
VSAPSSQFISGVEPECADRLEDTSFRVSGVLGGSGSRHLGWRFGRTGGWREGLGLGDRGFAAKAKKSGGKARTSTKHSLCFSVFAVFLRVQLLAERTMMTLIKVSFA